MMLSLRQAAEQAGVDKMKISRAIKSGKLSAMRESKKSPYQIDPSELARVFQQHENREVFDASKKDYARQKETDEKFLEIRLLAREVELKDKEIQLIETERRREREQLTETIDDLRGRLDDMSTERKRLTHLLTNESLHKKSVFNWFKRH